MPICLSKITISPPCHASISETSVVRATAVCEKIYSGFAPAGSLCLHPARLPYNLVGVPGYPRPQALVDHIRHISTHKPLHQCTLRSYRQDSRSHSSGFCILDVYSHRPVHRSEYLTGHLHRHHPDPRYYEAAVSCPYNRPPA